MNGKDRLRLAKLIFYLLSGHYGRAAGLSEILRINLNLPIFNSEEDFEDLEEC